jgi:NTE family protein
MVTSRSLKVFVDLELGAKRLEELEVPLFPVSTDVANSTQYVVALGTLGDGVRASGAFPGIFTPVVSDGMRCVDGGFINNVPASVVLAQGANLIVASNIVATPPAVSPRKPLFPGALGRWLYAFNPIGRMSDVIRSGLVLMHTNGDRESEFADVTFETGFAGYDFWDFTKGKEIARRAEPQAERIVEEIRMKWQKLAVLQR